MNNSATTNDNSIIEDKCNDVEPYSCDDII